ncbi:MAG: MFS transporter [Caulobacterales bacterium 68-7]|nr:MAG: MFS transporter [Caulobacterales bacterium 68-7]
MRDAGRLAAAIDIVTEIEARRKPAKLAVKAWGEAHRFAGSGDRAAIAGLMLDALRRRRSLAWMMGEDTPRAACIGVLRFVWGWSIERVTETCAETPHGPGALSAEEAARLAAPNDLNDAPPPVQGDYPDWLDGPLARVFGDARAEEGAALTVRAPVDMRVNTLKSNTEQVLEALSGMDVHAAGGLPTTVRIDAPSATDRVAPVETHPAFIRGWFEVQDAGSQIAAAVAGDIKSAKVIDLCAGGGGKTLALGAMMANTGWPYAYDRDPRRMVDIIPRAERAGLSNLTVLSPLDKEPLKGLDNKFDLVFVDAPCTGSGTWRRHPDTKWKLSEGSLALRNKEQYEVLDQAAGLVRPGGRIIYVTCSLLAEENEDRVAAFLEARPDFRLGDLPKTVARFATEPGMLRLSPAVSDTDAFFAAVLVRAG